MSTAADYILPNRKAFADSITRIFLKYRKEDRDPLSEDKDVDLCLNQTSARELFPYQKLIRDYMMIETPYRGILLYHGLGSGKTCSSIAIAESLVSKSRVVVMTPASLRANYKNEFQTCPLYTEQHWRVREVSSAERADEGKSLGISDAFLEKHGKFYTTTPRQPANFTTLSKVDQDLIRQQIDDVLTGRFTFVNYNGLTRTAVAALLPEDGPNPYDDSIVIIDEVHNFISRIADKEGVILPVYNAIYRAKSCKVVVLSGTPVINRPNEIAYLMNLLRGPIERITIPFKTIQGWDEAKMTATLHELRDIDTVEFNAVKKVVMVTRNPPYFSTVYNNTGQRVAVQYNKDLPWIPLPTDWVKSFKTTFDTANGSDIALERIVSEDLECLPSKYEEFADLFLDGLTIKNPMLLQRRIQGLVSYFKGADERLIPRRVDDDKMLEKVPMSSEQFTTYLDARNREMIKPTSAANKLKDEMKSFRVKSRLLCNFLVPPELKVPAVDDDAASEDSVPDHPDALTALRTQSAKYLTLKSLDIYSPKLKRLFENLSIGDGVEWQNQFVYSQYRSLEGLGVFAAILDANGWQPYKIINQNGQWIEDPALSNKPAYAFYTGEEKVEERELSRQIFNGRYEAKFPESLKTSIAARGKKLLCLLMASSSGAEGITLANVRHVHIMEPHWTPARHDQVIGRAVRICSHATLPVESRTVRVSIYMSVFSPEQLKTSEGPNIARVRRADTSKKRYEGGSPVDMFMSTDEYLYEAAFEKDVINQRLGFLLKQSAVDCEIHRKLHSREKNVISCMRFDSGVTGEDLAFNPAIKTDPSDASYLRNMDRKRRRLQQVTIKDLLFLYDADSRELFDVSAFADNQRLIRIGVIESEGRVRYALAW